MRAGELLGTASLVEVSPEVVYIDALVVRRDSRGHGLGSVMLQRLLQGRDAIWWIECRDERVSFFERNGFVAANEQAFPQGVRDFVARPGAIPSGRRHNFMCRAS